MGTATPSNTISTKNSTTAVLGVGAVFTGTAEDCTNYSGVTIIIDASHDSAVDGISVQFSSDGTNWDNIRVYTFDVSVTPSFIATLPVYGKYFRLLYTNGGTLLTHLRIQTILHGNPVLQPSYRLADSESPEFSGILTKSALIARTAGVGLFIPVQATTGGNLKVSIDEFSNGVDVGAGNIGLETLRVCVATDDVNLASIRKSISGAASPTLDSYANIAINLTTGADQVLVAAPGASKQIWIYGYGFTCGDADGQTVSLQDEDNAAIIGIMEFAQYGGVVVSPSGNFAMPVHKLATNKALEVDITGGDVDGWLAYGIVSV